MHRSLWEDHRAPLKIIHGQKNIQLSSCIIEKNTSCLLSCIIREPARNHVTESSHLQEQVEWRAVEPLRESSNDKHNYIPDMTRLHHKFNFILGVHDDLHAMRVIAKNLNMERGCVGATKLSGGEVRFGSGLHHLHSFPIYIQDSSLQASEPLLIL